MLAMIVPLVPDQGWGVLHMFCKVAPQTEAEAVTRAVKTAEEGGLQVVCFAVLGHKADLGFMVIGPDLVALRRSQSALVQAGLELTASYVSLTEVSEYSQGLPAQRLEARLHPKLPPDGKRAICFYAMSKRRDGNDNWYRLDYDTRSALMHEHGDDRPALCRAGASARDRVHRAGRLRVGCDAVRHRSRRPEGMRAQDALRRSISPVCRLRPVLCRCRGFGRRGPERLRRPPMREIDKCPTQMVKSAHHGSANG